MGNNERRHLTGEVIRVHRTSALTEITLDVGGRELAALVRAGDVALIEPGMAMGVTVDGDDGRLLLDGVQAVLAVWVARPLSRRSLAA